jgi:hypothetical protein
MLFSRQFPGLWFCHPFHPVPHRLAANRLTFDAIHLALGWVVYAYLRVPLPATYGAGGRREGIFGGLASFLDLRSGKEAGSAGCVSL